MIETIIEMQRIVTQISQNYSPEKIILFGSLASEIPLQVRDIDLLVIKETEKNPLQRTREVNSLINRSAPIDLLVYTPEEFENRIEKKDYFIMDVLKQGRVVYEKEY